ncbi:MAG: type II toxin-antitoxin system RelB/DinJ family antitoxin [Coriobacteriia bacterium]|nr:type II toxin-antitoxin system RelB/DinJ family antitoxin [Coriobacteriia bacterium]
MGNNTALIQARVEPELKKEVENILTENGLDIPTAIRIFFAKIRHTQGLPFEVRTYSAETLAALEEADLISRDPRAKNYESFAEILDEAKAELLSE